MPTDRQLVATWQPHEINHIVSYYGIPRATVKYVVSFGISRKVVYEVLRSMGYVIKEQKLNSRQMKKLSEVLKKIKNDPEFSRQNMEAGI